jgi:membrane protease YdiL (CAAX protease family)
VGWSPGFSFAVLAAVFIAYYALNASLAALLHPGETGLVRLSYVTYALFMAPLLALGAWLAARRSGQGSGELGLVPVPARRLWGWGGLGGLLGAVGNYGLFLLLCLFVRMISGKSIESSDAVALRSLQGPWLVVAFVTACILAPLCEELFFRGALYASMRCRWGRNAALAASAAVFALLHFKWEGLPSLFFLGLLFALLYEKSGSLFPGMVAHSLNNLLALAILLSF